MNFVNSAQNSIESRAALIEKSCLNMHHKKTRGINVCFLNIKTLNEINHLNFASKKK